MIFLPTDPRDVGCDQAREMLHIYLDLARGCAPGGVSSTHHPRSHLEDCVISS